MEELHSQHIQSQSENRLTSFITKNKKILFILGFSLIILIFAVVKLPKQDKNTLLTQSLKQQETEPYKINYEFAKYKLTDTAFKPNLVDYSVSLSEITNLNAFEQDLEKPFTEPQKQALISTNFFITANLDKFWRDELEEYTKRTDDWTGLYKTIGGGRITERKPENAVFVTTDFLLHVYHRLLEKEFEYIEIKKFYPALKQITDKVFNQALKNYQEEKDKDNQKSYERVIAFLAVPKAILDSAYLEFKAERFEDEKLDTKENVFKIFQSLKEKMPANSYAKAQMELNLVLESQALQPSPLFGEFLAEKDLDTNQDYTQFNPRSHYNKNSVLRAYFRTMMWYGRNNFALLSPELTRDALNITLLMNQTGQMANWEKIYVPTTFFVGKSDDLGLYEYLTSLNQNNASTVNSKIVTQTQTAMKNYQDPQIQSSAFYGNKVFDSTKEELLLKTKGFRFMGQRFTPDAFIFTSLTQGDEKADPETGESLPSSTTALFVMSILGNKTAEPLVQDWINNNAPNSKNILNKNLNSLKNQFSKITTETWTQNIYWAWLYSIKALFNEDVNTNGYPMFMQNENWHKKNLLASLGSWTELKHDTLLYAKQSYAEMGGGGLTELPPVPKGYVEPNIAFFDRLIALTQMTVEGLQNRDLLDDEFLGRNEHFIDTLSFFKDIAVKELQNETISNDTFEELRNKAGSLSYITGPLPFEIQTEKNARSALIADVHTDAKKQEILYEANGIPNYIYVVVKDQNGTRLTKGLVFNYFEFTNPLGTRLTDEDWQSINYTENKSNLPTPPLWTNSLIK